MVRNFSDPGVEIIDGEIYRQDWNGLPRFYWVKLYPEAPLVMRSFTDRVQERVKVFVQLEGDPTAWSERICDDDADDIYEALIDCVGDIEERCSRRWDREQFDYQQFDVRR